MQRLVRVRRSCPEVGWGERRILETPESGVLALRYDWRGETVVILHNLASRPAEVILADDGLRSLRPLFCNSDDRATIDATAPIRLDGYGYRWFRAHGERR